MNPTDIYLRAIKRTFADLYGVSPDTVDVSWTSDGETIIVWCDSIRFSTKDEVWRMAETKLYASCVNRWHARLGEHAWSDHQCLGGRIVGPDFVPGNPGTLL